MKAGGLVYTHDKPCYKVNMKNRHRRFCSVLRERKKAQVDYLAGD